MVKMYYCLLTTYFVFSGWIWRYQPCGRIPSAVGHQPTLATEMGELKEYYNNANGSLPVCKRSMFRRDDLTDLRQHRFPTRCNNGLESTNCFLGIYPAVEPLDSTTILDPDIVGQNYQVVRGHKRIEHKSLQDIAILGMDQLSDEDKTVARARKIQRFFSQPFHVAEVFTGMKGAFVPLSDTISGFKVILSGKYDHLPESAFYMVGSIEEAIEKAAKIER